MSNKVTQENKEVPDYIQLHEGRIEVTLSRPLEVAGAKVSVLSMREPTLDDQIAVQALADKHGDMMVVKQSLVLLCGVSPEEIGKLPLRDLARVNTAYQLFLA